MDEFKKIFDSIFQQMGGGARASEQPGGTPLIHGAEIFKYPEKNMIVLAKEIPYGVTEKNTEIKIFETDSVKQGIRVTSEATSSDHFHEIEGITDVDWRIKYGVLEVRIYVESMEPNKTKDNI